MTVRMNGEKNKKYFVGGCWGVSKSGNPRVEKDIDEITESEKSTFGDAIEKWGIDVQETNLIDPIVITGPIKVVDDIELKNGVKVRKELYKAGRDRKIRGYYSCTYILGFTEKQAVFYMKKWNVYDYDTSIWTEEIFYKDIVSINIEEETVGGVVYFRFTLNIPGREPVSSGYNPKENLNETHIQAMKNLIREKKNQ
ncbi:MAG: hypothetical protein FWH44_01230 [Methanomassiliicoccaceae archaeon]|nr:hypothetical protein [Methanomassiliicoccaceae archaeon]